MFCPRFAGIFPVMKPIRSTSVLTPKEQKDLKILALFTSVYCRDHHPDRRQSGWDCADVMPDFAAYACCDECRQFLGYAVARRLRCPLQDKPSCKKCTVHCYRSDYRDLVRKIMRYSGRALVKKGRIDLLWHYLF